MNGGELPYILYLVLLLVFVGSTLASRGLPGKTLKMALAWVAIFAVGILLMSLFARP